MRLLIRIFQPGTSAFGTWMDSRPRGCLAVVTSALANVTSDSKLRSRLSSFCRRLPQSAIHWLNNIPSTFFSTGLNKKETEKPVSFHLLEATVPHLDAPFLSFGEDVHAVSQTLTLLAPTFFSVLNDCFVVRHRVPPLLTSSILPSPRDPLLADLFVNPDNYISKPKFLFELSHLYAEQKEDAISKHILRSLALASPPQVLIHIVAPLTIHNACVETALLSFPGTYSKCDDPVCTDM